VASYALRRIALAIPTLLVVLTIVFCLVRFAPGDPATAALGPDASADAIAAARQRMGLTEPLLRQYASYLGGLAHGDLGRSLISGRPIAADLFASLPHTIELTLAALLIGLATGLPLALWAAMRRNEWPDYLGRIVSLVGLSFPAFHLGILMILLFSIKLHWLPITGAGAFDDPVDNLRHLVLPAVSLGLVGTAYVARVARSTVLKVKEEDFIRAVRAKGLRPSQVTYRHTLRSALIPVTSLLGVFSITLLGSAVTTELVFARPGIGRMLVQATLERDYNVIQSVMSVVAVMVVLVNLGTDLAYGFLDPRVRHAR